MWIAFFFLLLLWKLTLKLVTLTTNWQWCFQVSKNMQKHYEVVVRTTFLMIPPFWNLKASVTHSLNDRIYNFATLAMDGELTKFTFHEYFQFLTCDAAWNWTTVCWFIWPEEDWSPEKKKVFFSLSLSILSPGFWFLATVSTGLLCWGHLILNDIICLTVNRRPLDEWTVYCKAAL